MVFPDGYQALIQITPTHGHTSNQLKQGFNGRPVKQIKVLPKPGCETVSELDDIEQIVPWSQLQSLYAHYDPDTQSQEYMVVDPSDVKSMFPSSEDIRVVNVIPASELHYSLMEGHHYHIFVQSEKKSRTIYSEDQDLLSVFYHTLKERQLVAIGKYISANHEKCCAIHPEDDGLVMSVLIPSNFIREREHHHIKEIDNAIMLGSGLLKRLMNNKFDPDHSRDCFDDRLREHIEQTQELQQRQSKAKISIRLNVRPPRRMGTGSTILDRLASM